MMTRSYTGRTWMAGEKPITDTVIVKTCSIGEPRKKKACGRADNKVTEKEDTKRPGDATSICTMGILTFA